MSRSLLEALNASNPNNLAAATNAVRIGDALGVAPMRVRGLVVANVLVLPERFRAAAVLSAFATVGAVTGQKTPVPQGTAVATTQVGINAEGNILFNAATDLVTEAEVHYVPFEGQLVEELITVAASAGLFNFSRKGNQLISASVVTGVIPGAKTVDFRGAAVAAGEVVISAVGTGVTFNAADIVAGTALVRYIAQLGVGNSMPLPLVNRLGDAQTII